MIVVERPCAIGAWIPDFQVALYLPSQCEGCYSTLKSGAHKPRFGVLTSPARPSKVEAYQKSSSPHQQVIATFECGRRASTLLARTTSRSVHTPHPAPYTRNPTPCTLHPAPCTLHPKPYTLHPTPCTLHPTPFTIHPTPYSLHLKPETRNPKTYTRSPNP